MTDPQTDSDTSTAALADRFGFSADAVRHLHHAVEQGGGDMAMFDHPEFAGPGQWMRGGLIMLTDANNHGLKSRVDALCNALSEQLRRANVASASRHRRIDPDARAWDTGPRVRDHGWPAELGQPSATGTQNDLAYAYFDAARRLAIRENGQLAVYDTGEHRISGVAQSQQGAASRLVFTSQLGEVPLERLTRVDGVSDGAPAEAPAAAEPLPQAASAPSDSAGILDAIERLGELHRKGLLTDGEFASKKQELLARL